MGNSPGAQQNPMYCMLAGALNVSFDGGVTWNPVGASAFGTDAAFRADFDALVGPGLLSDSDYNPLLDLRDV